MEKVSTDALYKQIGKMLKTARENQGLSQQDVAEYVQVSKSAISRWESGEVANMGRSKIELLAKVLRLSPGKIIFGENYSEDIVPFKTKKVPLLGEVAAGEPILCYEEQGTYVEIDDSLQVDFCLRAKGDSMIDARINDGDLVFVRRQPTVNNGEIAVVMIDDEVTLKRFYKANGGVILKPENSKYQPMFYTEKDFKEVRILGKAILFQSNL